MRRMMAAEVAAAKARGETISENTSTSSGEDGQDDSNISDDDDQAVAAAAAGAAAFPSSEGRRSGCNSFVGHGRMDESCMSDANSLFGDRARGAGGDDDKGHEADMDDTSMSSRASSRMMGESIDSMSAM